MRLWPLFLSLLVGSCTTPTPPSPTAPAPEGSPSLKVAEAAPDTAEKAKPDNTPIRQPKLVRTRIGGISIEAVTFDSRSHHLVVADQPGGPASRWADSRAAGQALGGIAAINGGFFNPDGSPLGKVVASGKTAGAENRASSLGSGYYVESPGGGMKLVRRQNYSGGRQALQAGPFLVENSKAVSGLSQRNSSARSFLATDGKSGWILARTGPSSLEGLGSALAGAKIGEIRVQSALNLDGGRSSDLWVSGSVASGPLQNRPLWNKPVRNFLVLSRRD
ncbi:phosphodiester glycosidase family protein [Haloferula helveola]